MNPIRDHPHLYEINTWAWLYEMSHRLRKNITLRDVPDSEWDALAELGFDFIWLMGIWERSPESRREFRGDSASFVDFRRALPGCTMDDVVGSPYAIHRYEPDARLADWSALNAAREKLHARGMRLMLDFVPNHVALDHPWTREHPEYFIHGSVEDLHDDPVAFYHVEAPAGAYVLARARDPYFPPWRDVAQLNIFHPGLRAALLGELVKISQHCDGVRCDMAMLVLNENFARIWGSRLGNASAPPREFWQDVRAALPDFTLLAESYWGTEQRLIELGFDFAYDKNFYDALRGNRVGELRTQLSGDFEFQRHLVRFLENHDEDRAAQAFGPERLRAAAAIVGTAPGMRFYHQGQLEGRKIHFPIQLSHIADEAVDAAIQGFYRNLLQLTRGDAFHSDAWRLLNPEAVGDASAGGLIACDWRDERSWKLVVVNFSTNTAQARIRLGDRIAPGRQYIFDDVLNRNRYERDGDEIRSLGLYVRLDPFEADIFDITLA
jgi:glycosidase